ncbi:MULTISPECIES: HNH endonuclease [unclassified Agrobacterium]|jgi:putative restriction endonuclease|uniref:HNH endonuclease n=1 Tax=unclassified Agrobacterium TaxID=2632611 RepID=UPI00244C3A1F|nr:MULTISPECIES: HNH endonuclease [unclassified Agrobacterium]MDH0616211.1 HNH endonuclease [Agrobacterium sp. GD03872]MDH0698846.1 HNH endonuclease [Agrobacterium sp. GD03871]MDH1060950.1 HNH endonuclease [Agrobacterium sp. GD03992]MDH2211634.1 HNH endonuclease [Agrobacterium sp. GD03643]MDH2221119.1 HNH endonuclease [Agrobacterium sp. GD03638]
MGFGVFIHRSDSIYDDSPAEQYQFPGQYLGRVQACLGDWILYYEPRKVAFTRGYFAIAKVAQVIPDPKVAGMYLALIEPGSYLDFINPVPFGGPDGIVERGLLNEKGRISGRAQAAVRPISAADFDRIVSIGLDELEPELPRLDEPGETRVPDRFDDRDQEPFAFEKERERVAQLSSRIVRNRLFRQLVLQAYDKRCAITGLKLINGGGRAEVDAAHIRPVEANGPDILCNGIALSGTAHWMFDRGLIGLSDELEILISRQANDRESIRGLINKTGRAIVPSRSFERPHPHFLQWHRQNCFKA